MKTASEITGQELVNALERLNIRFILGAQSDEKTRSVDPVSLIAALAQSDDARLRLALIPLFLEHPEFSKYAPEVADQLDASARLTLQCYYTAAFCLLEENNPNGKHLPDYFSKELNLSFSGTCQENLHLLAKRHRELSGMAVNWLGTYLHAAKFRRTHSTPNRNISRCIP